MIRAMNMPSGRAAFDTEGRGGQLPGPGSRGRTLLTQESASRCCASSGEPHCALAVPLSVAIVYVRRAEAESVGGTPNPTMHLNGPFQGLPLSETEHKYFS